MKVKKGDTVLIMSGKDKGKTGKIIKSYPKDGRVLVEGVNLIKKHVRPKKEGEKGQVVTLPSSIDVSNVKIICPKCKKPARIGYKLGKGSKGRICKKCSQEI